MARALDVARRARGRTHPNPPVGAVVVGNDGTILGEGATQPAGGDHAEVMALRAAGPRARGATLAVTLEPCNHHGHTPPCTEAILQARHSPRSRGDSRHQPWSPGRWLRLPARPGGASRDRRRRTGGQRSRTGALQARRNRPPSRHRQVGHDQGRQGGTTHRRRPDHRQCRLAARPRNARCGRRHHHRSQFDRGRRLPPHRTPAAR